MSRGSPFRAYGEYWTRVLQGYRPVYSAKCGMITSINKMD